MTELEKLRQELAQTNQALLQYFLHRMELVDQVAEHKGRTKARIFAPEQEEKILAEIHTQTLPELQPYARVFMGTLMRLSRERQYEYLSRQYFLPQGVKDEHRQIKKVALGQGQGQDCTSAIQALYPTANLVPDEDLDQAANQVAAGEVDLAILPLREDVIFSLEKHALFIQACLTLLDERYIVVGSVITLPKEASRASILIQPKKNTSSEGSLPLVINILTDLGFPILHIQSLRNSSLYLEFEAEPSATALSALEQISQEAGEMSLLGWWSTLEYKPS